MKIDLELRGGFANGPTVGKAFDVAETPRIGELILMNAARWRVLDLIRLYTPERLSVTAIVVAE
jgi:hypothetical protein